MTTKEKSPLVLHAERELQLAGWYEKNSDYGSMIPEAVMELIEVFSKQGHSGSSAKIVNGLFTRLADFKNLLALSGEDNEWNEVGEGFSQNSRVSSVFKESDTGRAYYLDAIVWRDQNGITFSGQVGGVNSRQTIKSFPFFPKTFFIDVISQEDREIYIKNVDDLDEVWKYYDRFEYKK